MNDCPMPERVCGFGLSKSLQINLLTTGAPHSHLI